MLTTNLLFKFQFGNVSGGVHGCPLNISRGHPTTLREPTLCSYRKERYFLKGGGRVTRPQAELSTGSHAKCVDISPGKINIKRRPNWCSVEPFTRFPSVHLVF